MEAEVLEAEVLEVGVLEVVVLEVVVLEVGVAQVVGVLLVEEDPLAEEVRAVEDQAADGNYHIKPVKLLKLNWHEN